MSLIRLRPACADQQLRPLARPHFRGRPWRRPWQWPDQKDLNEAGVIDIFRVSTLDEALVASFGVHGVEMRLFVASS